MLNLRPLKTLFKNILFNCNLEAVHFKIIHCIITFFPILIIDKRISPRILPNIVAWTSENLAPQCGLMKSSHNMVGRLFSPDDRVLLTEQGGEWQFCPNTLIDRVNRTCREASKVVFFLLYCNTLIDCALRFFIFPCFFYIKNKLYIIYVL